LHGPFISRTGKREGELMAKPFKGVVNIVNLANEARMALAGD
jgi:hypothetical protein